MTATVAGIHLGLDTHANRPAANTVPDGSFYSCSTHSLIYKSNFAGNSWATWATLSGGLADQGAFTYLDATEAAAPATPASGFARIYAKADGRIYSKDDAGVEYGPFDAAGGAGGPLLYVDATALHADGDDFDDASLTGWTLSGIAIPGDVTAVTTEVYDDTCLDVVFGAQGDKMYKAVPGSSDYEITLVFHGLTQAVAGQMIGLFFTDNAGTGTGFSLYNDAQAYLWVLSGGNYASSGPSAGGVVTVSHFASSAFPFVIKLKKVGTTITGSFSINGGARYHTATRTDATTFTRMGIGAFLSGSATPARIGRFNVEEL